MKKLVYFLFGMLVLPVLMFTGCKKDSEKNGTVVYYTVVFESNGGTTIESQTVKKGAKSTAPEAPQRTSDDGKIYFGGWYTDPELTQEFNFETKIEHDTVLYAGWLSIPKGSYKVSFDSAGGDTVLSQIVEGGKTASEPSPKPFKTGFALSHWYQQDEDTEFVFADTPITDTTELTAKWNQSGIHPADYEDDELFCINLYQNLAPDTDSIAW